MKILWVPLIALFCISSAASQSAAPTTAIELTGEIHVDGKPLEKGRILFYSPEGQIVGCVIREGKYEIEKVKTGQQIVTIDGQRVAEKYADPETSGLVVEVRQDTQSPFDFHLQSK